MKVFFLALLRLELLDDLLYVLRLLLVRYQHRVMGFNDNKVFDPNCGDQATLRVHK